MSVTRSVFYSLPELVQKSAWDHHFEVRGDVWVKDTSGVLLTASLINKHFEMSKISILCLFPPFHFCTVKTLQEDLLNSDFPKVIGHISEATGRQLPHGFGD